jgi:hypothetical protein
LHSWAHLSSKNAPPVLIAVKHAITGCGWWCMIQEPVYGNELVIALQEYEKLGKLFELWSNKKVNDKFPYWRDIDVTELGPWLGNLNVVEINKNPFSFQYRIFGTSISEMINEELTNKKLEQINEKLSVDIIKSYKDMINLPRPMLYIHKQPVWHGELAVFTRLMLPMATDNADNLIVMVGAYRDGRRNSINAGEA